MTPKSDARVCFPAIADINRLPDDAPANDQEESHKDNLAAHFGCVRYCARGRAFRLCIRCERCSARRHCRASVEIGDRLCRLPCVQYPRLVANERRPKARRTHLRVRRLMSAFHPLLPFRTAASVQILDDFKLGGGLHVIAADHGRAKRHDVSSV